MVPRPNIHLYEVMAETKIKEQERIRDESQNTSGKSIRLSRRAIVVIRLTIMLLIIVGIVIMYHMAH